MPITAPNKGNRLRIIAPSTRLTSGEDTQMGSSQLGAEGQVHSVRYHSLEYLRTYSWLLGPIHSV